MRRDYRLLLAARVLRSFAFGFMPVLLGIQLEHRGLGARALGGALAIGVLAASFYGLPLAGVGLLMALTGADLALATQPPLLVLAGATGMLGAAGVDLGPFLALEQAMLTESVTAGRRNRAFGRYSLTGGLAVAAGGLAGGLATTPERIQGCSYSLLRWA